MRSNSVNQQIVGVHNARGFSLVSVVITTSIAAVLLSASAASIVPLFRNIGGSQTSLLVDNAAESATDFTVGLLNDSATRITADCSSEYNSSKHLNSFVSLTPAMFGLPDTASVDVWVRNVAPKPPTEILPSQSFDPILTPYGDPSLPDDFKTNNLKFSTYGGSGHNGYRMIECRVQSGPVSKLLISTLKPTVNFTNSNTAQKPAPMFGSGLQAVDGIIIGSASTTGATSNGAPISSPTQFDPNTNQKALLGGDVSSLGSVTVAKTASVGGHLQILQNSDGITSGTAFGSNNRGIVTQTLKASGSYQEFSADNVLNAGNGVGGSLGVQPSDQVLNGSSPTFSGISAAPNAPSQATFIQPIQSNSNSNSSLAGDLVTSSISVSNSGTLTVASATRIFLDQGTSSSSVVNVAGNMNADGAPSQLQIFYNGTKPIIFQSQNSKTVNAVIYAPNATVSMASVSGKLTFNGAVVAKSLSLTNTDFRYDYALKNAVSSSDPLVKTLVLDSAQLENQQILRVQNVLEPRSASDPRYKF